jgi:hypothetical protein
MMLSPFKAFKRNRSNEVIKKIKKGSLKVFKNVLQPILSVFLFKILLLKSIFRNIK